MFFVILIGSKSARQLGSRVLTQVEADQRSVLILSKPLADFDFLTLPTAYSKVEQNQFQGD